MRRADDGAVHEHVDDRREAQDLGEGRSRATTGPENRTMLIDGDAHRVQDGKQPPRRDRCAATARAGRPPSSGQRRASVTDERRQDREHEPERQRVRQRPAASRTGGPPIVERR